MCWKFQTSWASVVSNEILFHFCLKTNNNLKFSKRKLKSLSLTQDMWLHLWQIKKQKFHSYIVAKWQHKQSEGLGGLNPWFHARPFRVNNNRTFYNMRDPPGSTIPLSVVSKYTGWLPSPHHSCEAAVADTEWLSCSICRSFFDWSLSFKTP